MTAHATGKANDLGFEHRGWAAGFHLPTVTM